VRATKKNGPDTCCYLNATVLTGDPARRRADAVGVSGSRITAVGTEAEAREICGPQAEVVDCGGGTILPGFIDSHAHLLALSSSLSSVDLSPQQVDSVGAVCARLRSAAEKGPEEGWVRGHGYDEFYLRERRHPTRAELDAAVPERPVRLRHRTRHASLLNSVALRLVGEREPHLLEARGVERDPRSGEMTGVLHDLDVRLGQLIPKPGREEIRAGLAQASDLLLAAGVTSLDDASVNSGADEVGLLRGAVEERVVRQRVRCLWGVERHGLPADPTITAVKLALDEEGGDTREFGRALEAAHRKGLQVAVHAVEGPAIAVAVAAFESVLSRWPRPHRHRLEHCALCPPPLARRIGELGLAVVTQPGFIQYVGDRYLEEVPVSEQNWLYPLRSLGAEGVVVAGSSDAPVGPMAPLVGVAGAVCRRTRRGQLVAPEEAIELEAALQLYGRGAAWVTQADDGRGWLAKGRVADLVVLGHDLTGVAVAELETIPVAFVVIDGQMMVPRDSSRGWGSAPDEVARSPESPGRVSSRGERR